MGRLLLGILLLVLVAMIGVSVWLGMRDAPVVQQEVTYTVPNETLGL